MKKQILAVAAALVAIAAVPAQSHAQQVAKANVPFGFQAGSKAMPAGEYYVQQAFPSDKAAQVIARTDSSASTFILTNVVESTGKNPSPKLIFHCYSNECFLNEIWTGNGKGLKLGVSAREKELSRVRAEKELAVVSLPLTVKP
jgi:hypothetical protein